MSKSYVWIKEVMLEGIQEVVTESDRFFCCGSGVNAS